MSSHDLLAMAFDNSPRRSDAERNNNIMKRAIEIGMDPFKDSQLFWIAEQSLKAKMPDEWIECKTEEGQTYYFNLKNEDSTWEHPGLDHYRQLYAKVKKQQEDGKSGSSESLPEIGQTSARKGRDIPQSPRVVAAHALKQKRDAEKLGGDAVFWRTRYDLMEKEKDKIEHQAAKLEKDLQENLLQGARLIETNHKLKTTHEDIGGKLRVAARKIVKHLSKRGFKIDPRRSAGDEDLESSTDDILRVIDAHVAIDEGDRDENGFSLSWDGALSRIKKELDYCFTYDGDDYTVDQVELKVKLEDIVQMVVSFGSYLNENSKEGYVEMFLDHVVQSAKDSTMVPLEKISRVGVKSEAKCAGRPDVLLDSPLVVSALRKDLDEERELSRTLGKEVETKKHELQVMHTKLLGLQARLEDNRSHEELLASKFNALTKSIEDIKLVGELTKDGGNISQKVAENSSLRKEIASLNSQLNIANKRATDAERRLEEAVHRETDMRSELTTLELNLKLKLDKKKATIHEMAEQKQDLEQVSKELYDELQNALLVSARLEKDNEGLRDLLDEYRAGDASVAVVREKLEIEYERSKSMEEKIESLQKDLTTLEKAYREIVKVNEKLEIEMMENREEKASLQYETDRQRNRSDVLTADNLALEETVRNLKNHIMRLNDKIVEIKGNIRVFCRVRPLFVDEINGLNISQADLDSLVKYPDYNVLDFNSCPFEFDRVFEPRCTQEDIFEEVEPFARSVMAGCRVCVFAYGQTSSGKTHTMEGTEDDSGVNIRCIELLLELGKSNTEYNTDISLSVMEIYNENIRDLLSMDTSSPDETLEVCMGRNGTYVNGLSEWPVRCREEAQSLMARGWSNRLVGVGDINEHSSRSHLVTLIKVERMNVRNGQHLSGYLYLVDLAGSERVKLTAANSVRLREAQNINKSLSTLGEVISSLAARHKHVPYRNSKLTFVLQDALRESSKVLMFVNINPSPVHTGESTSALQFATRCRSVELGHAKRAVTYYQQPGSK